MFCFCFFFFFKQKTAYEIPACLVGSEMCIRDGPQYIGGTRRDSQIEQMKEKAFYEKETGISYLRVTKEQCEELSEYYFRAREKAAEELNKLKKNYWELFG